MGVFLGRARPRDSRDEKRAAYQRYWMARQPVQIGSYADVTVDTSSAMQSVAFHSAVDLLASLVSELPASVVTGQGLARRTVATPGNIDDPGGDGMGMADWLYRLLTSWMVSGNATGVGTNSDHLGRTVTVDLFHPDDVHATVMDGAPTWWVQGRQVTAADDFHHWRVNPVPGRLLGLSPIELHASSLGKSLAVTRFGRQWFTDGAHPAGMLTHPADLKDPDGTKSKDVKKKFTQTMYGTRDPLVLGGGWDWKEIQISPEESQFLQTEQFSEAQCARILGPGMAELLGYGTTGGSITYQNVVDRREDVLWATADRWINRAERVLSLLTPRPQRVELDRDAFLRTTASQRFDQYGKALGSKAWLTRNEVRTTEGRDPIPEWDVQDKSGVVGGSQGGNAQGA